MPSFVHPALLWGLLIASVPVLIHLINLLRHRRIRWAAMEFLLVSQKRNRARVLLKQLLLLLVRMLAVATLVLVLAQPLVSSRLGHLPGGSKTHHILLLDDSFSMSDHWADTSAFQEAKAVVERIADQASRQPGRQTFTLLRFSQANVGARGWGLGTTDEGRGTSRGVYPRAARDEGQGTTLKAPAPSAQSPIPNPQSPIPNSQSPIPNPQADLLRETVDTGLPARLRDGLQSLGVSHTAAGPLAALEAVGDSVAESQGDQSVVYLISDFRARQWDQPGDLRDRLARLSRTGAKIYLIHCVQAARPNLAIADLSPAPGTRAAGVPLSMEVTVKNFGPVPVQNAPVLIEADGRVQPGVKISRIPPGEGVKERFSVHFSEPGEHVMTARLQTDAVAVDNARYGVVDFPEDVPALLIDGDPEALNARYLSAALAPGGPVRTGIRPQIENPRYLSLNPLAPFRAIWLLGVERLDDSAVEALEDYVQTGGGVAVFLGERSDSALINEKLYRDGKGFFPLPVAAPAELLVDRLQNAPDLRVSGHPIFQVFAGERNSFLWTVMVGRYFSVPKEWQPQPDSATQVIAWLRNGAPLAAEKSFGQGRVVAFLTTAAPVWNNWARNNPSFVVAVLQLQAFLSTRPGQDVPHLVGAPLELRLDPSQYEAQVRFSAPDRDTVPQAATDAVPSPDGFLTASLATTDLSGVYEALLKRKDGTEQIRRFALNVEAEEGDLRTLSGAELAGRLQGVPYEYQPAAMFQYAADELAGVNLSGPLLYMLVLLLVGEQVLAWSAGYHPRKR